MATSDAPLPRADLLRASPRMFENPVLDKLSRVHPTVPLFIFVPAVTLLAVAGLQRQAALPALGWAIAGLVFWSLTEYWLHRLVFHWQPKFRGGDRLHFVIHGIHHDHPNDAMRLVMPPAASIPLASVFAGAYLLVFGTPLAYPLFAGLIAGYLIYDYTHYHLHHRTPTTRFGKRLREQHMRHHFQDHRYGFGVSSPVWDLVFGTLSSHRAPR